MLGILCRASLLIIILKVSLILFFILLKRMHVSLLLLLWGIHIIGMIMAGVIIESVIVSILFHSDGWIFLGDVLVRAVFGMVQVAPVLMGMMAFLVCSLTLAKCSNPPAQAARITA